MLDILDIMAVREVVAKQKGVRREICELLMDDCNQPEIAERLGLRQPTVSWHMAAIRRDFIRAGFGAWCWRPRSRPRQEDARSEKNLPRRERRKLRRQKRLRRWWRRPVPIS